VKDIGRVYHEICFISEKEMIHFGERYWKGLSWICFIREKEMNHFGERYWKCLSSFHNKIFIIKYLLCFLVILRKNEKSKVVESMTSTHLKFFFLNFLAFIFKEVGWPCIDGIFITLNHNLIKF
jgi:hypothetical protein